MMLNTFSIESQDSSQVIEITRAISSYVEQSGVKEGICILSTPHTTAGLTITSFYDPAGWEDLKDEISRLVPTRVNFKHQYDTPADAAGHVKSFLVGTTLTLIIHEGKLLLGSSQGIFFLEFDGPRQRSIHVKIMEG